MCRVSVRRGGLLCAVLFANAPAAAGSFRSGLAGGFLYGVASGRGFWSLNNAPGWMVAYSCRPRRWLLLEAGLEQVVRPTGSSVCCRYIDNAEDELCLVPFGVRYSGQPPGNRFGVSVGGGGAYADHSVGSMPYGGGVFPESAWGAQAVAPGDRALTRSGRFRLGIQARFYYLDTSRYQKGRLFTIGPTFTFSWE